MKPAPSSLGPAFEWCDRSCSRCPLQNDCLLFERLKRIAFLQAALIEDLDGWEPVLSEVWSVLESSLARAGVDAASPHAELAPPSRPTPRIDPTQRPLIDAVDAYYLAAFDIYSPAVDNPLSEAADCVPRAMLLVQRMLRIAALLSSALQGSSPDTDRRLTAHLLLVDKLEKDQWFAVMGVARETRSDSEAFERARTWFRLNLDPLLGALPRGTRGRLSKLVRAGEAPSPFATVGRDHPQNALIFPGRLRAGPAGPTSRTLRQRPARS